MNRERLLERLAVATRADLEGRLPGGTGGMQAPATVLQERCRLAVTGPWRRPARGSKPDLPGRSRKRNGRLFDPLRQNGSRNRR